MNIELKIDNKEFEIKEKKQDCATDGYGNSGYGNSGDRNSGDRNSGNWNSGYRNSGNWNSGYGNSTNRSSGIFCNEEPQVILFNKPTCKKWADIDHPHFVGFELCEWVNEDDMTEEEKQSNSHWFTTKGYLKTLTYKEAWSKFWEETDNKNKQKFINLPNFDADIFEDITGIRVCKSFCKKSVQ